MNRLGTIFFAILLSLLCVTAIAAQEVTPEVTPDVTAEATLEATTEATAAATPEATSTLPPGAMLEFPGPGGYSVQVTQGDIPRAYGVYIPSGYADLDAPAPLVIVLHAANGTGLLAEQHTGFDAIADQNGFVVVYPDGIGGFWNDGRPVDQRINVNVSDSAYMTGIIAFVKSKLSIDPARVYLTGYSMGAMMAIRASCELSDRITAVAVVASTMPEYASPYCQNSQPMPILFLDGTDDHSIPWIGQVRNGQGYMSAFNSLEYWSQHNHCADQPSQEVLEDGDSTDGTRVIVSKHTVCDGDSEVVLYGIYLGGHTWPGRPNPVGIDSGTVSYDIDGTNVIWTFFSQHARG